ncbi:Tyrosine recombinase XerC [Capillimicrobium parvum]|uniref:Tyrosine recombinase XerC n=2 Tax=Capillimicrobium parvum TaxID=2884022 RepID=A0A9E6XWB5_9ACTN|nr:Tyrosine recombinase XerC [Capillimicrobium parvum]
MSSKKATPAEGVATRHSKQCRSGSGGRCNCSPTYQANVWDNRARKRIRKSFTTLSAAKQWRRDASTALERGGADLHADPSSRTLAEAADEFIAGARSGAVRSRSGTSYRPSTVRGYERCLRLRVKPALGHLRIGEVRRRDLQRFVDDLLAEEMDPATVVKTINPVQAIFRRLAQREEIRMNPAADLELPKGRRRRERIASPAEAAALIAALDLPERALFATAMYAGLRRGELRALRVSDIDLAAGLIRVARTWDDGEGEQEGGKSEAARRRVPIAAVLRWPLGEHLVASRRTGDDLAFGMTAREPFYPSTVRNRALAAWARFNAAAADDQRLDPITLHEARHTYASLMIAAGVNAKALQSYMGHSSITVTFDLYGHLMPGNEEEAAGLLDAFLRRAA